MFRTKQFKFNNKNLKKMDNKEIKATVIKGGPAVIDGDIKLVVDGVEKSQSGHTAICRCGQTKNNPFCDGTHAKVGFDK